LQAIGVVTSTNLRFGRKPCCPVGSDEYSLTVAGNGPVLLQDAYLIEKLAHFVREHIPDRVYPVKGGGAFGYFEVTADVTEWTKAAFLNKVGKRMPLFLCFSIVAADEGGASSVAVQSTFWVSSA
jgi:catalase